MPADFDACVEGGGRVRTKDLGNGRYIKICYLGGKSYSGEVHTRKEKKKVPRRMKARRKI